MRPTLEQIDELEDTVRIFHRKNHGGGGLPLESCDHPTCREARGTIAWIRDQLQRDEAA